jgi:polygalacturonase
MRHLLAFYFSLALSAAAAADEFNVRNYGAIGDGAADDTVAVQTAFDACDKAGGGMVRLPAGSYLCRPLVIGNKTTLHLDKDAVLLASDDPAYYARTDKPNAFTHFLTGKDLEDVTIEGEGTIDGAGRKWWIPAEEARQKKSGYTLQRPNLIVLTRINNLVVRGVTIQNAPKFHFVPTDCVNVLVEDATFLAPERAPNTDAIDPSNCRHVTIRRCLIDVGDDNVAIKASTPKDGRAIACESITVEDCTFKHGHGMSIGSETFGGVKDLVVRNCTFEDTDNGIRIKSDRTRGGVVENVLYENLTMKNVRGAITITSYYPKIPATDTPQPVTDTTPAYRNITIRNLTATSTKYAGVIVGLPESPIRNVVLENVHITSERTGLEIRNVEGIEMKDVVIEPRQGEPIF